MTNRKIVKIEADGDEIIASHYLCEQKKAIGEALLIGSVQIVLAGQEGDLFEVTVTKPRDSWIFFSITEFGSVGGYFSKRQNVLCSGNLVDVEYEWKAPEFCLVPIGELGWRLDQLLEGGELNSQAWISADEAWSQFSGK